MSTAANRIRSPAPKGTAAKYQPAVVKTAAAVEQPVTMKTFLEVYWTLIFAVIVITMAMVVEPKQDWKWPPELDLTFKQAKGVLKSPWLWACWGPMLLGVVWLRSFFKKAKLPIVEQSMMMWWWTNACFFHTNCDVMSGYYQVLPGLTQLYSSMTPAHLKPRWSDARLHLDVTYFLEMTVEVPLALFCVLLYIKRHPARYIVEIFAVAVQLAGTVTYYVPALIRREQAANWISFNDRLFGAVWIIVPLIVLRRHWLEAVKKEKKN